MDETSEQAVAAWCAAGVDLRPPIPLTPRETVGCYYDGPADTAWATVVGTAVPCAIPGCSALVSSGYEGVIVPGRHPIRICNEHVVIVRRKKGA